MDARKRKQIEAAGYQVTTVAEFVGLSPTESELIEIGLDLVDALIAAREHLGITQQQLAKRLDCATADIKRVESGADRTGTMDILLRALLEVGLARPEIGGIVAAGAVSLPSTEASPHSNGQSRVVRRRLTAPRRTKVAA